MIKHILLLTCLLSFVSFAQESVGPITANTSLWKERVVEKNITTPTFDSTFVYFSDTLDLPFFDEFSQNNFQQYNAGFSDPNVETELYHAMLNEAGTNALMASLKLSSIKTYKITYDLTTELTDTSYYDSTVFQYNNLETYPVVYENLYAYPNYFIFDTIGGGSPNIDTLFLDVDYCQDSARIFLATINEPSKIWLDSYAYHNYRMAVNPISLGVVTFDGLDDEGYPYSFGSTTPAIADYLTSKPLNMSAVAADDSVYFSFLYQNQGFGDAPEEIDSLVVEFYSPVDGLWQPVWSAKGGPLSEFKVGHVRIIDPKYFEDGFQFRFYNHGSVAGAIDQFNVDYVHLRPLSGYQDTLFKDFAVVYPINTLLEDYTQVPWDHYRNTTENKMNSNLQFVLRNNETVAANNSNGGSLKIYLDEVEQTNYDFVGANLSNPDLDYAPRTHYASSSDLTGGYEFDRTLLNDTMAEFTWVAEASAQFSNYTQNDSTFGTQTFKASYAYDDGSAEKAYGTTGAQSRLAYKFTAYEADTLVAVQMHFVPSVEDASDKLFLLTVWDDNGGEPGEVLYQDEFFDPRTPEYVRAQNAFYLYYFKNDVRVAVGETFYVGWRQIDPERLNIGMDMNIVNNDKIFYSVDGESTWNNSSIEGSLMIRPMFSTRLDYQLSVEEFVTDSDVVLYPNPVNNTLNISVSDNLSFDVFVYDLNGRCIFVGSNENQIDMSALLSGMYIVNILSSEGELISTRKIIKK